MLKIGRFYAVLFKLSSQGHVTKNQQAQLSIIKLKQFLQRD